MYSLKGLAFMHVVLLLCLCLVSGFAMPVLADNHALLIGVSQYKNPKDRLEGAVNDVMAVKKSLQKYWGFATKDITVLTDTTATRGNILQALGALVTKVRSGDRVLIYFSGHGTSEHAWGAGLPLPYTNSGALIPYGYHPEGISREQLVNHLIIGKRDLKPLLLKMDAKNAQIFVIFDSCYSGKTVRGLEMAQLLPVRALPLFEDDEKDMMCFSCGSETLDAYPYKNIIYFSAAGSREQARDISKNLLPVFPTIDNQAHGAFTNALLHALAGKIQTDRNKDGRLSYSELYAALKDFMQTAGYPHTPQILPVSHEDINNLAMRSVLSGKPVTDVRQEAKQAKHLFRLSLSGPAIGLLKNTVRKKLKVHLTDKQADLSIKQKASLYRFINNRGDVITRMDSPSLQQLINRIEQEIWKKIFAQQAMEKSRINLALSVSNAKQGSFAYKGESIAFTVRSEEPVYLVLLYINSGGNLEVLYPYLPGEMQQLAAGEVKYIPEGSQYDRIIVQAPFGVDHLMAFGFEKKPVFLHEFIHRNGVLEKKSALFKKFMQSLEHSLYGVSELDLLTVAR